MGRLEQQYKDHSFETWKQEDKQKEESLSKWVPPWIRPKKESKDITYKKEKEEKSIGDHSIDRFLSHFGDKFDHYLNCEDNEFALPSINSDLMIESKLTLENRFEKGESAINVLHKIDITKDKSIIINLGNEWQELTVQELVDQGRTAGYIEDFYNEYTANYEKYTTKYNKPYQSYCKAWLSLKNELDKNDQKIADAITALKIHTNSYKLYWAKRDPNGNAHTLVAEKIQKFTSPKPGPSFKDLHFNDSKPSGNAPRYLRSLLDSPVEGNTQAANNFRDALRKLKNLLDPPEQS